MPSHVTRARHMSVPWPHLEDTKPQAHHGPWARATSLLPLASPILVLVHPLSWQAAIVITSSPWINPSNNSSSPLEMAVIIAILVSHEKAETRGGQVPSPKSHHSGIRTSSLRSVLPTPHTAALGLPGLPLPSSLKRGDTALPLEEASRGSETSLGLGLGLRPAA